MSVGDSDAALVDTVEAAAICGMTPEAWRNAVSRSKYRPSDPPMPEPVGVDTMRSGWPRLYDRAEVEAWAKVRRRRSRI